MAEPVVEIGADYVKVTLGAETMGMIASAASISQMTPEALIVAQITGVIGEMQAAVYANVRQTVGERYLLADTTARASIDALLPPLPTPPVA